MFELIIGLGVALSLLAIYPFLEYITLEAAHRDAWGLTQGPRVAIDAGAYRSGFVPAPRARGAPFVVRITAISCFAFGQLFVIGLPVAMFAVVVSVVLIGYLGSLGDLGALIAVAISALAIAGALPGVGAALLRCGAGASQRARKLAAWSLVHHLAQLGWLSNRFEPKDPASGSRWFYAVLLCVSAAVIEKRRQGSALAGQVR
jgi:hypothetical protein